MLDEIELEKQQLLQNATQIQSKITELNERLATEKLSEAEKREAQSKLEELTKKLISNQVAYEESLYKTQSLVLKMEKTILQKDSLNSVVQKTLEEHEETKKDQFRERIFFGVSGLLLASLAVMFFLFNRRNRKQRNQIHEQNVQLEEQNARLEQQKTEILAQAENLQQANHTIAQKNDRIHASINAASRIQQAMMPEKAFVSSTLPDSFVLFNPRDLVSGDFFWMEKIQDKIILTAANCTGHGVPGAIVSMVGMEELNKIVLYSKVIEPDKILKNLHENIRKVLKQESNKAREGMDMALCVIDQKAQKLHFSGAKNPLIFIRKDENNNPQVHQLKGSRSPIGGWEDQEAQFTTKTIDLVEEKTSFYVFSDGYQDQFGGDKNKKFMKKRFRNLLFEIHEKPMTE